MNILGIDFGHGEISASYQRSNTENVKQLKLVNTTDNNAEKWKIPSYLYKYQDSDGNFAYSLDKPLAPHTLLSEIKKPISYMDETDKEHYRVFIQLVYQRLLECNSELHDNDFVLAIACPTKWLDYQKDEYKEFFEEALGDYDVHIYAIMNESDAAFFAKYKKEDQHKNVLVVDYGSSTIDFTLVSHGKKVDLDDMSSSNLGASAIENAVLALYSSDNQSNYRAAHQFVDSFLQHHGIEWIDFDRFILSQIREKKEQAFTKRDPYIEQFRVSPTKVTGFDGLKGHVFAYDLETTPLMDIRQLQEYVAEVKNVFAKLKERTDNEGGIDKIIMSGGACMMAWVKDAIMEVFEIPDNKIELDTNPAFVVCDGIVKYCQKLYECICELEKEVDRVNVEKLLQESDNEAINSIAEIDVKNVLRSWESSSSEYRKIKDDLIMMLCSCYKKYNGENSYFVRIFKEKISARITTKIQDHIRIIIENVFGKNDVGMDDYMYVYNYNYIYSYTDNALDALATYLQDKICTHLNWDLFRDYRCRIPRNHSERENIVKTLTVDWRYRDIFENIDGKIGLTYNSVPGEIIENVKSEVRAYALRLMEEKQLFKTSFSR